MFTASRVHHFKGFYQVLKIQWSCLTHTWWKVDTTLKNGNALYDSPYNKHSLIGNKYPIICLLTLISVRVISISQGTYYLSTNAYYNDDCNTKCNQKNLEVATLKTSLLHSSGMVLLICYSETLVAKVWYYLAA